MEQPPFWFAAKRYGYGWGPPVRWQGWVVLAAYFVLLLAGIRYLGPQRFVATGICVALLTTGLVIIVAIKGEKPVRWRWGKD